MRRTKSKLLSLILVCAMALAMVPALSAPALAADYAGSMTEGTWVTNPRYIEFGEYNGEPLLWRVLEVKDNDADHGNVKTAFLLADELLLRTDGSLDARQFHSSGDNTWSTSDIRTWLNGDFMDSFTSGLSGEAEAILETEMDDIGSDTDSDAKVFLLSLVEVRNTNYFNGAGNDAANTDRAASDYWWLRSPGYYGFHAAVVNDDGSVNSDGDNVYYENGIRPALKVNLASDIFTSSSEILYPVAVTVDDGSNNIAGARVSLSTGANAPVDEKFSGSDGVAHLKVPSGSYDITVTKAGYEVGAGSITVSGSGPNTETVTLTADDSLPDEVYFGAYSGNVIKWRVLDIDRANGKALLLVDEPLFQSHFDGSSNVWDASEIQAKLNGNSSDEFLHTDNFSAAETSAIMQTTLSDVGTNDQVFLLSMDEAGYYLSDNASRLVAGKGWWLRTAGGIASRAACINNSTGAIFSNTVLFTDTTVWIRPAMWVDLTMLGVVDVGGNDTLLAKAAAPAASPGGGAISGSRNVTLQSATAGATIYYTTDGSNPTNSAGTRQTYTSAVTVQPGVTLKAYAEATGYAPSDVITEVYTQQSSPNPGPTSYTVKFDLNGGEGSITSQSVTSGGTAKAPTDPTREGYKFTGWYTDAACTEKYDFATKVTKSLTLYAGWEEAGPEPWENPFIDVKPSDWFYDDVRYVYENGLMVGISEDEFDPDGTTTRGMVVTVLWRLAGEPEPQGGGFTDLTQDWYKKAAAWANENGIVEGYGNGLFGPEDEITREQLVTMLYRYAKWAGLDVTASDDLSGFPDAGEVSDWALQAMRWAVAVGIIEGRDDGSLDPGGDATRAELAAVLHRFLEL